MSERLLRQLSTLFSDAAIVIASQRAWHSATFAGWQLTYEVKVPRDVDDIELAAFARTLADREFDLSKQIVADIGVTRHSRVENCSLLVIDALVLDD